MDERLMTLAEQLRQKKEEMQITSQELADLLGVSRQSVSLYLNGHRLPGDEVMKKIRDLIGGCADRRKIERVLTILPTIADMLTEEDRMQIFSLLEKK